MIAQENLYFLDWEINVLFQEFFNFLSLEVKVSKTSPDLFWLSLIERFLLYYQLAGKEIDGILSLTFILLVGYRLAQFRSRFQEAWARIWLLTMRTPLLDWVK